MPPSAATADYDAHYAQALMDDMGMSAGGAFKRALGALSLCALGAIILLVTLTYNPFDSTGDTAGIGVVQNALGQPGASLSNILMQSFGWGAVLLGILTLFAGIRGVFWPRPPGTRLDMARRFLIVMGAIIFFAATVSAFPIPQRWPMATGLGGMIGDGIYFNLKGGLDYLNIPISGFVVALFTFICGGFCLARFFGIVGRDVLDVMDAAGLVWATIRVWIDRFAGFLRRRFDKSGADPEPLFRDVADTPKPKKVKKPKKIKQANVAPAPKVKAKAKPTPKPKKEEFHFPDGSEFVLPGTDLLKTPPPRRAVTDEGALRKASENLHRVLGDYGVKGEMGDVRPRPCCHPV